MSSEALLRALRNERVVQKRPFTDRGFFPGPEPLVRLPANKVLVDREGGNIYITIEDLIQVVSGVLRSA